MIDSIRLGKIGTKAGTFWYTTALHDESKALFKELSVKGVRPPLTIPSPLARPLRPPNARRPAPDTSDRRCTR